LDEHFLADFQTEAEAGLGIHHSHVARTLAYLDLQESRGAGWLPAALVMQYLDPSLAKLIADLKQSGRRLPQELAVHFTRNILDGVEHLHTHHTLVHRDLKPGNILIARARPKDPYFSGDPLDQATAQVSDLGTICRRGQKPPFLLGQDGWKAPELFHDQ